MKLKEELENIIKCDKEKENLGHVDLHKTRELIMHMQTNRA